MTIADNLLSFNKDDLNDNNVYPVDTNALMADAEKCAVDVLQDWEHESTTYVFADSSCIVVCNGDAQSYGSLE